MGLDNMKSRDGFRHQFHISFTQIGLDRGNIQCYLLGFRKIIGNSQSCLLGWIRKMREKEQHMRGRQRGSFGRKSRMFLELTSFLFSEVCTPSLLYQVLWDLTGQYDIFTWTRCNWFSRKETTENGAQHT